jgi:hypothetical protein
MNCILPDLTEDKNNRIQEILEETHILGDKQISPEICTVQTSKKNTVLSIHPPNESAFVLKLFISAQSLENELKIYKTLSKSIFGSTNHPHLVQYAIPDVLYYGDDFLITKYIDGYNTMDIITQYIQSDWNPVFWEQICTDLIQWIINFADKTHFVPLDCHVRNFIMVESTIFGVDFEELGEFTFDNLLRVFVTIFFSILGSYPGVIEGLELEKNAKIGIIFLRKLLLIPNFQHISIKILVSKFLDLLREEAASVIQRRLNLKRGSGYNTLKIKQNLDFVISSIQSDFD